MKCISCQNEIQDGVLTCPLCGAIQQINNGVNIAPPQVAQPVQPVQPVQPIQPVQPVQTAPIPGAVPVPPAQPQAVPPVAPPSAPTGTPAQSLGTVTQRDSIAQGIQSGNLVNGMYSADEIINSKEHQNFVMEEKKGKKKKIIITCAILLLLIGGAIGGFYFYKAQMKTADKRIGAFFDVVQKEINGVIKNDTVQQNNGDYKLNVKVDENDKQYGISVDGKFAYDLKRLVDVTANVTSLKYGEELIDKDPINLEFYLNDSKAYFNLQNLYDKYIFVDFDALTSYKHNISQNDVIYTAITKELVTATKKAFQSTTSTQKIGKSSISGKNANIVSITLNADQRKALVKKIFENLEDDNVFIEQYKKITGKDRKDLTDTLELTLKDMKFDADTNLTIELHTGIFKSEFIGLKIASTSSKTTEVYVIKPISNGYSIKETKDNNQVLDLRYTKTKGATSTTRTTTRALSGTVYDGKIARNIDVSLEIISNVVVDVQAVKVKDSIRLTNMTEEDLGKIITGLDKYPKIKALVTPSIEEYKSQIIPSTGGCNDLEANCLGDPMMNGETTENTSTEEVPADNTTPAE